MTRTPARTSLMKATGPDPETHSSTALARAHDPVEEFQFVRGTSAVHCEPPSEVCQMVHASSLFASCPSTTPSDVLKKITWFVPASLPPMSGSTVRQLRPPSSVMSRELRFPTRYASSLDVASIPPR